MRRGYETTFTRGQPLRVLLLEDEPDDAQLCILALERSGYTVHADIVSTYDEVSERLDAGEYDIVLADYQLPTWTGLKALELIQERGLDVPFILVTGHASEKTALRIIERGADDYVLKDRLDRLALSVRRVLREHRLIRAQRQAVVEKEQLAAKLREATEELRRLNGMLPICVTCKRILDAKGQWHRVELFLQQHSRGQVSPCVCPECSAHLHAHAVTPQTRPRRTPTRP